MYLERFAGKVALMTGATQGIGLASARRVGQEGGKVIISSRREENVKNAVNQLQSEGIEASGITCHQGKKEDRRRLIQYANEKYGGFDCVLINAGVSPHVGNIMDATPEQFQKTFDMNVKEVFQFIQECVPVLEKRGSGSIVTNSTAGASDYGMAFAGRDIQLYLVSKLTLATLAYHLDVDCFNKNIRVNTVLPGMIDTPFLHGGISTERRRNHMALCGITENDPAARLGRAEEIGAAIAFLLSDDASYITGQSLTCCGPQSYGRHA